MVLPSVLPPQQPASRTPNTAATTTTTTLNAVLTNGVSMTETHNVLSHPAGAELSLGEGTYVLRDELHLATPPPHPSEAPLSVQPNNPLAHSVSPTAGTKLTLAVLSPRKSPALLYRINTATSARSGAGKTFHSIKESSEVRSSVDGSTSDTTASPSTNDFGWGTQHTVPAFGEGNALLLPVTSGKDSIKRRKPKNNILKSNSSFISRVIQHEGISKWLQERDVDGIIAFANINRGFEWLDLSSSHKADYLTKILFTKAHPLCADANTMTKGQSHLDLIIGFSSGDTIWYEPFTKLYGRINKNGVINDSPVSDIRWIPGSETLFLAAHSRDLVVYDVEREDAPFVAEESGTISSNPTEKRLNVQKSVNSTNQKSNPVSSWRMSNKINAFAFSPDRRHLAVVSDGNLSIIDYLKEKLLDIYTSYYGSFICVCWSPDGKYILTGGQDDLVSIWSLAESRIVARCQGHRSFVTALSFDPWRCDERNYRFGSVGEDCRLLLWDFSVGMLHRPKASSVRQPERGSVSSYMPRPLSSRLRSSSNLSIESADEEDVVIYEAEPRSNVAILPPVMSKVVDADPLCWLGFEEDCIMTTCSVGHIRTWDRPKEGGNDA
ncbi:MAG: hypothetical protein M1812_003909 [Candelaria pacifica]|nr:MAG: hypothetical protein M1812_003909 [Candelaria pacifica]